MASGKDDKLKVLFVLHKFFDQSYIKANTWEAPKRKIRHILEELMTHADSVIRIYLKYDLFT